MKILLVRLSSMGDLIHTLPAVEDLARQRPDVELHWLCEASFADIARLHPFVHTVWEMRWRQWRRQPVSREMWQQIGRLKRQLHGQQFDYVLDSQGLVKSAVFAKMAGVPVKGLDWHSAREPLASLAYRQKFAVAKGQNAVLRNRLLFAAALDYPLPEEQRFGVRVPQEGRLNGLSKPYYVALHATSRDSKLWMPEHWLTLLDELHRQDGATVYLPWGNETERLRAEHMAARLPFARVCERLNLLQAADLLQGARGVIGVDTGLLHLANALDVPLVGIYTDTDPAKTGVQPSAWAGNIGGCGQMPDAREVLARLNGYMDRKYRQAA